MKKASLWEKTDSKIKCKLCARNCLIEENKTGICRVRKNIDGELFSLNYGKLIAVHTDPIEKKPFFHFLPGSLAISIASAGCNFFCAYCCNYEISQIYHNGQKEIVGESYTPEQIVKLALENNCRSISYTYTEPTVFFEFCFDTGTLARKKGLMNNFVTNGYLTEDTIKEAKKFLDAAVVDIKGCLEPKFYQKYVKIPKVEPILNCIKVLYENGIWVEITNLIVPKIGESVQHFKKFVKWVADEVSDEIPFHILRFSPTYKLDYLPPTPVETLEKMMKIAKEFGIKYVYIGNVWGHESESTYCPDCGEVLIKRYGFYVDKINLENKKCPNCGGRINIVL
jgi:pyruvate formate lyase activating enzyme